MPTSPAAVSIAASNVGHVFTHLFTILYATAVLHLPAVFGVPYGELLALSSLGLILYGVAALPAGWLGDRWSQVGMMVVFFVGIGAGALVTGLAESTTGLFVGLSLIGLFASIYHPVGIAWLVASAERQGMALGWNGVFGSIGGALAPVFVGLMIDHASWRTAFVAPGILSVVLGFVLAVMWRFGAVADARTDRAPAGAETRGAVQRVFVILTLTMAASGFVYAGITNTMPKLFEAGLGPALASSYTEIGLYVGAVIGFSSLSSILGGWLADRYSPRLVYIVFWALLTPTLFVITSLLGVSLLTMAFLALLFNVSFAASENLLVARYTPFRWRALAYGAKFVLALGIGGLTVKLAGTLFDRAGNFDDLYLMLGLAAIAATAASLMLPRPGSRVLSAAVAPEGAD
ncbi:MAG: MFS transporter [Ectothiorhodospiraceae bacterium]|nr:MFS transporter [Chromatiales bacterium]MCP5154235.1 MFS transporter [Ectothiorhodospiraceae bacterium]